MKHLNIRVFGKVQGVFFRATTRDMARSLGLSGYVRNDPDGSVYIEAEGEETQLSQFTAWCRKGPPHARVSHLDINEGPVQHLDNFDIRK